MTEQTEALKMAIEYAQDIKRRAAIVPTYHDALIQVCKKALEQSQQEPVKSKGSKYLGLINLESEFPLTDWERKELIKYSMECLLDDGELGKLGMLCHRFEDTIRYFENKNPVKEFLNNKSLYTHPAPSWQGNKEFVGLSDDEVKGKLFGIRFDRHTHNLMSNPPQIQYSYTITENELFKFARAIEQALKEKNT